MENINIGDNLSDNVVNAVKWNEGRENFKEELELGKMMAEIDTYRDELSEKLGFKIDVYKNNELFTVVLKPVNNGNYIAIEFENINQILDFIENIVLNSENAISKNEKINITSSSEKERVKLYYNWNGDANEQVGVNECGISELNEEADDIIKIYCNEKGIESTWSNLYGGDPKRNCR